MTRRTRRRLLLSGAVGIGTLLGGCSSGPNDSGPADSPSPTGDAFRSVRTEGTALLVELGETTLDSVSVVAPDGTSFADEPVQAGVSTVEIPLGTEYEPGEFQILGVVDGESVAETSLEIRPELEIVEVGVGVNHPDRMPSELGTTAEHEALVRVRNTGTGVQSITQLTFQGDVPNPEATPSDSEQSGIFDEAEGRGSVESVLLPPGEEVTLYSSSLPFSFEGEGTDCEPEPTNGEFTVSLQGTVGSETTRREFSISYTGSESYDGCSIGIAGEGS